MHPNNLLNIGTNPSVWIFSAFFIVVAYFVGSFVEKKVSELYEDIAPRVSRWHFVGVVAISCTIWIMFGGFGSGKPQQITPSSSDGVVELISEAPQMPTEEDLEKADEERKPDVLKELESNLSKEDDEDEYIKRAIERSKQMRGER